MSEGVTFQRLKERLSRDHKWRARVVKVAAAINYLAVRQMAWSRGLVRMINAHTTDRESDRLIYDLPTLHKEIAGILERQRRDYPHYSYFYGHPYQSLGILGIFGERATDERFDTYGLAKNVGPNDVVLDIGCNCGFVSIVTAYRTGCRVVGVDINPYMIEIGRAVARYLKIEDRVELKAEKFQDLVPDRKFSVAFSFATHWTDDRNYRVELLHHLKRVSDFLDDHGLLVFESHSADVGSEEFYKSMEAARSLFDYDSRAGYVDNGTRELYLMRKRPGLAGAA
jgi:SAM-dependent methyltransferase